MGKGYESWTLLQLSWKPQVFCLPVFAINVRGRKHHTSLCLGTTAPPNNPQATSDPVTLACSSQTPTGKLPSQVYASLAPIPVNHGQISLLKTAVATVAHNLTHCEANIPFDEGAQHSFITQTLRITGNTLHRDRVHCLVSLQCTLIIKQAVTYCQYQ